MKRPAGQDVSAGNYEVGPHSECALPGIRAGPAMKKYPSGEWQIFYSEGKRRETKEAEIKDCTERGGFQVVWRSWETDRTMPIIFALRWSNSLPGLSPE